MSRKNDKTVNEPIESESFQVEYILEGTLRVFVVYRVKVPRRGNLTLHLRRGTFTR